MPLIKTGLHFGTIGAQITREIAEVLGRFSVIAYLGLPVNLEAEPAFGVSPVLVGCCGGNIERFGRLIEIASTLTELDFLGLALDNEGTGTSHRGCPGLGTTHATEPGR